MTVPARVPALAKGPEHWGTATRAIRCVNGHLYLSTRETRMRLEIHATGVLPLICCRCEPETYQIGIAAGLHGVSWVWWYAMDKQHYDLIVRLCDDSQWLAILELVSGQDRS